jgi:uncharacterized Zn finger protein (UPF0148 family)
MSMNCEHCGRRLESYEGESYCPECTYYEAVEAHDRATDEALAVQEQNFSRPVMLDDEIPF